MVFVDSFRVNSDNVQYTDETITSSYKYETTTIDWEGDQAVATPKSVQFTFQTERTVPKLGVMLVGLGGNNGSTLVGSCIANKEGLTWMTKEGVRTPNYWGSITQATTVRIGADKNGDDVFVPLKSMVPFAEANQIVWGGWDISSYNLADAMKRAKVLPYDLQRQLAPYMKEIKPLPSVYFPEFIAANQQERADNVLTGTKQELLEELRKNIRDFKTDNGLDKVIILWTANTERFAEIIAGHNDTAENMLRAVKEDKEEISPSTLFALASILENVPFINGSPQNTFVPGVLELAEEKGVYIGGDDFKSGQTKIKSVLVDFLVSSGIKPVSIVSYNHLGNNDGKNLSVPQTFRSKEISKTNVVDDMVGSNHILFGDNEHPDHCVVIKYVPYVADSKRAMDEYTSEIFMGGLNTISIHNTCEDSLLAAPIILDLVLMTELMTRIKFKTDTMDEFSGFHSILSILSFLCKAPLVPAKTPVVNAFFKQRGCIENVLRALVGLPPENNMLLEHKVPTNMRSHVTV